MPRARRSGFVAVAVALSILADMVAAARPAGAEEITIVALGNSLTAGFGLAPEEAFPVQLEAALRDRGHDVRVLNAGVSGDTSAGGIARLDWAVGEEADGVIVELGGNDALRGITPEETRRNLDAILAGLGRRGLPVLLAGILAPRNLGRDYAAAFDPIYPELAEAHGAVLYGFFLDGAITEPRLMQDAVHPNAKGVALIVERMLPAAEELVARIEAARVADD